MPTSLSSDAIENSHSQMQILTSHITWAVCNPQCRSVRPATQPKPFAMPPSTNTTALLIDTALPCPPAGHSHPSFSPPLHSLPHAPPRLRRAAPAHRAPGGRAVASRPGPCAARAPALPPHARSPRAQADGPPAR
eukprot:scaffold10711_cov107-Isochrysis_galbana.AAC.2